MGELKLYWRYMKINYLSGLQYKGWSIHIICVFFIVATDPMAIYFLFARFGRIGEWGLERIMLIYGIAVTSFGLAEVFARGFDEFPLQIRTGSFDRILLRPRSTFVQILGSKFHIQKLARVIGGFCMIGWSLYRQGITINPIGGIQLILALAGGSLTYIGVFIFSSAISFWTVDALNWIYVFTNGSYQVTKCPPVLLPKWLKNVFTFFMPMLVFSYYPAASIGGWGGSRWMPWLALPAGGLFFMVSWCLWRIGVSYYTSTGS